MPTVEEQIRLIADAAMDALDLDTAAERRATPRETVLDHRPVADTSSPVRFTEEVVTMIDVKTTDPTQPRQKRPMRIVAAGILAAAAAVVAIVFVASSDVDVVTPTDEPSPTVPPTSLPQALPKFASLIPNDAPADMRYVPGTYFVDEVTGRPTARIYISIGAGWRVMAPGLLDIVQGDIGGFTFSRAKWVFSDACHWADGYNYRGSIETVDGLVAALSEQGGWVDVTAPSDISVDGYAGKAFQRTAPAQLSDCDTMRWNFSPWGQRSDGQVPVLRSWQNEAQQLGGEFYEPGEVETLWVLDIDGTLVVINTRLWPSVTTGARLTAEARALAGPTAAARADSAAVLGSIRIVRE